VFDALDQVLQQVVAGFGTLDVSQLGHLLREQVLILETGHRFGRRDPSVALPIDADENVALREIGAIEVARRMRTSAHLKHHRRDPDALDRLLCRHTLFREFVQSRAHEDTEPLIGCSDRRGHEPRAEASCRRELISSLR
jgi:hypothetical protein